MIIYVVKPGDTIEGIAAATGSSVERILRDNALTEESVLVPGQAIVVLQPNVTYTVQEGDTFLGIAEQYDVAPKQLLANNPALNGRETLYPGETVVIDYATNTERRPLSVNGYAYPYIDREILRKTLPYLTYLTLFTYGFTENGDLIGIDDEEVIQIAKQYQVAPLMLLSTLTDDGTFSNELASKIFSDAEARNRLFDQILENMRVKGYYGLDVDFEFILPEDRDNYVQFLTELKARLEPEGYPLVVALAPKTSGMQRGLLYESHDYPAIGAVADSVLIMTYEWGYTYGPPLPVAPLNKVKEVLDYGVSVIPRERILQGMPNYGYDWTLPYVRGESMARSIGNVEAVEIAERYRATIQFDEQAQTPFFYYTSEDGKAHVVWFEDARSIRSKLLLNASYPLQGISYWNVMRYFPQNWLVVNQMFTIRNVYEDE